MRTAEEQFLCEDEEDDLIGIPYDLMYNRDYMGSAGESNMLSLLTEKRQREQEMREEGFEQIMAARERGEHRPELEAVLPPTDGDDSPRIDDDSACAKDDPSVGSGQRTLRQVALASDGAAGRRRPSRPAAASGERARTTAKAAAGAERCGGEADRGGRGKSGGRGGASGPATLLGRDPAAVRAWGLKISLLMLPVFLAGARALARDARPGRWADQGFADALWEEDPITYLWLDRVGDVDGEHGQLHSLHQLFSALLTYSCLVLLLYAGSLVAESDHHTIRSRRDSDVNDSDDEDDVAGGGARRAV